MGKIHLEKIPRHVAIIMDGNGRWADAHGVTRRAGHTEGARSVQRCVDLCLEYGIPWMTLYAFSTENWKRPLSEVSALMGLLNRFLKQRLSEMMAKNVRLLPIGEIHRLPQRCRKTLLSAVERTSGNAGLNLVLALSYGSRQEITDAVRGIAERVAAGELRPEAITEKTVGEALYTGGMPDPDLMIRTSGERRLSNFLLWQLSYAEIHVTECLWPDFGREQFEAALRDYASRKRRFGKR